MHLNFKNSLVALHSAKAYTNEELRTGVRLSVTKKIIYLEERLDNVYLTFFNEIRYLNVEIFSKGDFNRDKASTERTSLAKRKCEACFKIFLEQAMDRLKDMESGMDEVEVNFVTIHISYLPQPV